MENAWKEGVKMKRGILTGLTAAALMAAIALSAVPAGAELSGQQKLLSCRAAQADAYRQLVERVKGLRIESETYVRDFVAESDEIATSIDTFIKGARIVGRREMSDGTCEIDVEITIQQVEEELRRIVKEHRVGGGWHEHTFDKVHTYYNKKVLSATGMGAPRPEAQTAPPAMPAHPRQQTHPDWAGVTPQNKLLARRAAIVDAYRNMSERVKGLQIDSQTYVRDFVTESDVINTSLDNFIKGVRIGEARYVAGPICEVDVEVTIQEIQQELKRIVKSHYHGRHYHEHSFDKVHNYYEKKILAATGYGVPRAAGAASGSTSKASAPSKPEWAEQYVRSTGSGVPPSNVTDPEQARLLAERAAEIDAKRNLIEKIHGIRIDSSTYVRDYVTQHDEVDARLNALLRGAQRVDTRYLEGGLIEVDIEAPLDGVWDIVKNYTVD
jgi:hypothetical protein